MSQPTVVGYVFMFLSHACILLAEQSICEAQDQTVLRVCRGGGVNGVTNVADASFFIFMDCCRSLPWLRQRTNVHYKQGTRCFIYKGLQKIGFILGASESPQNAYYEPFAYSFIRLYARKTPEPLNGFLLNLVVEFRKGKSKGKGHPCIGTEALYRPYGP
jgi:hypothetical protein